MQAASSEQIQELQKRAEEHIRNGRSQAAIDELDRASEDLHSYPHLYKLKGVAKLLQGNSTESRLIFDQLEGCFGDDAEFLNIYGVSLRRERDLMKALEVYKRGLELKPDEAALLSNYGNLLIDLNRFEEAQDVLNKALKLFPDHKDARQNLVRLEKCKLQSNPSVSENSSLQAETTEHNKQPTFSLYTKDEAAASDWLNLAAIAQREKNFEEALMFARKAIDSQIDLSPAYKLAGEVLYALNRIVDAERMLLYGALIGEDDEDTIANIASITAQNGHGKLASLLFKRVLASAPEHQVSLKNLNLLHKSVENQKYSFKPII